MLQSEVGLEILLLRDLDMAKRFIQAELGPLALDTRDNERLRETLDASFRFGSHVAAAEYLQLHEHTVRNRLQKAEQLLGSSIRERSTENCRSRCGFVESCPDLAERAAPRT